MTPSPVESNGPIEAEEAECRVQRDRRRAERLRCATVLKLVVPDHSDGQCSTGLRTIEVKTQDASATGIRFVSPEPISRETVYVQSDRVDLDLAEIKIVRSTQREDATWEFGAELIRFVPIMDVIFAYERSGT